MLVGECVIYCLVELAQLKGGRIVIISDAHDEMFARSLRQGHITSLPAARGCGDASPSFVRRSFS